MMGAQSLPQLELTPNELRDLAARAQRRGFTNPTEYIREIIKADSDDADVENLMTPEEGFRQGWQDIKAGRVITHEEFRRRILEDDAARY